MNKSPGLDLAERARALQPLIARDADEIERTRRLTPAVTAALIENGLYRSLLPKSFGGSEAPLETFMQMQEEIAKADGSPEIRTILFPMSSAVMYDVWDTIGLRGTGTDSYSVDNLFIPDKFAALRDDPKAVREKGPLYRMSTNMVFSMG